MKSVLLHDSHTMPGYPDGRSGAPGEAVYIREEHNPRVQARLEAAGVEVTRVAGDLTDRPEYHRDYDLFYAPHYEANLHYTAVRNGIRMTLEQTQRCGLIPPELMRETARVSVDAEGHVGGWLEGRADDDAQAAESDRFLDIFRRHYVSVQKALGYDIPERLNWLSINIRQYYAFRWTTAKTPGTLQELGVGAPSGPDYDWLRYHAQQIADAAADAILEFLGVTEGAMNEDDRARLVRVENKLDLVLTILTQVLPGVWLQRMFRDMNPWTGKARAAQGAAPAYLNPPPNWPDPLLKAALLKKVEGILRRPK